MAASLWPSLGDWDGHLQASLHRLGDTCDLTKIGAVCEQGRTGSRVGLAVDPPPTGAQIPR